MSLSEYELALKYEGMRRKGDAPLGFWQGWGKAPHERTIYAAELEPDDRLQNFLQTIGRSTSLGFILAGSDYTLHVTVGQKKGSLELGRFDEFNFPAGSTISFDRSLLTAGGDIVLASTVMPKSFVARRVRFGEVAGDDNLQMDIMHACVARVSTIHNMPAALELEEQVAAMNDELMARPLALTISQTHIRPTIEFLELLKCESLLRAA